jgi:hypothetical protein
MRELLRNHPRTKKWVLWLMGTLILLGAVFVGALVAHADDQNQDEGQKKYFQWIPLISMPGDEDYPRNESAFQCDPNNTQQRCGLGSFFLDCGFTVCSTLRVDDIDTENCTGPAYVDVNRSRIRQIGEEGWASIADIQESWGYSFIDRAEVTWIGLKVYFSTRAAQEYLIPRPQDSTDYAPRFSIVAVCSPTVAQ